MTIVDSHLHVWRAAEHPAPAVRTMIPPDADVPLELAARTMAEHAVERAVLVQPVFRGEDNSYVAACARAEPEKFAAVCVVDPRAGGVAARLAHWFDQGCRGVRLRPRITPECALFGHPASFPLWEAAERLGIVVSLLAGPEHVGAIDRLAERFARVPIVIDHLAHPDPASATALAQLRPLLRLARRPGIYIKLSGFHHFSAVSDGPRPYADCRPLVRAVYEHFGPGRLLWGSDFPHVLVACGYARSRSLADEMLHPWAPADRAAVLGENALRLYWPAAAKTA